MRPDIPQAAGDLGAVKKPRDFLIELLKGTRGAEEEGVRSSRPNPEAGVLCQQITVRQPIGSERKFREAIPQIREVHGGESLGYGLNLLTYGLDLLIENGLDLAKEVCRGKPVFQHFQPGLERLVSHDCLL